LQSSHVSQDSQVSQDILNRPLAGRYFFLRLAMIS